MWWQKWHSKNYACYVLFIYLLWNHLKSEINEGLQDPHWFQIMLNDILMNLYTTRGQKKKIIKAKICKLLWAVTFITFQIHSCYHIPCWWFIKHDITWSKTLQSNTFEWGFCKASLALCITGLLLQVHSNRELNLTELHC